MVKSAQITAALLFIFLTSCWMQQAELYQRERPNLIWFLFVRGKQLLFFSCLRLDCIVWVVFVSCRPAFSNLFVFSHGGEVEKCWCRLLLSHRRSKGRAGVKWVWSFSSMKLEVKVKNVNKKYCSWRNVCHNMRQSSDTNSRLKFILMKFGKLSFCEIGNSPKSLI